MRNKLEALFDGLTIRERILVLTYIEGLKKKSRMAGGNHAHAEINK